ncbi:MAG: transporter substrate-binding domain-containing protein [Oscillospiraceae bacterium]|jgi:ABC-type amino acid transport substrate-binding protein|nr:transporter substrate-binding domain-containing protein [Oscillospiraceae bacterium]
MKKLFTVIAILLALTFLFTACKSETPAAPGGSGGAESTTPTDSGAAPDETPIAAKKVLIGNSGGPRPYAYLSDDEITYIGYDYELIAAIDELLPEYDFEIEVTEFASIFAGVDSGRYLMGMNNITKKPEREEKYLFGKEFYSYNTHGLLVRKDNTDIYDIEDLGGKKVYTSGDGVLFSDVFYRTFNEQHPGNEIITVLSGADSTKTTQDLVDGVVDFALSSAVSFEISKNNFPELYEQLELRPLTPEQTKEIEDPYAWYIFPKTDEGQALADAIDGALVELAATGKMQELSIKYFGFNMTGRNDDGSPAG